MITFTRWFMHQAMDIRSWESGIALGSIIKRWAKFSISSSSLQYCWFLITNMHAPLCCRWQVNWWNFIKLFIHLLVHLLLLTLRESPTRDLSLLMALLVPLRTPDQGDHPLLLWSCPQLVPMSGLPSVPVFEFKSTFTSCESIKSILSMVLHIAWSTHYI